MTYHLAYEQVQEQGRLGECPPSVFELKVAEAGRMVLARVDGSLEGEHAAGFLTWMRPLCGFSRGIVVDLRRVSDIDGSGVRALVVLQEELENERGELRLVVQPGSSVEQTLCLLSLQERFKLYDTATDAWVERLESAC
jgi:anti-anti-sigma factor